MPTFHAFWSKSLFAMGPTTSGLVSKGSLALLVVGLTANTILADDDDARPKRPGADFQQRVLAEFDADKDGQLDETERAKAREAMARRQRDRGPMDRGELVKRFDKDGDGRLNEEERQAAMKAARGAGAPGQRRGAGPARGPASRAEFLKRFDKDGDGKLDDAERAAARAAFESRPGAGRRTNADAAPDAAKPDSGRVDKRELLKKFDADGDGKLTGEERAAARKAFEEHKNKKDAANE